MLECKNCCYFSESLEVQYEHCCFREWGHSDWELAPCDDPDFNDEYEEEEDYEDVSPEDYNEWVNASCGIDYIAPWLR